MRDIKLRAWDKKRKRMFSFTGANMLSAISFSNNNGLPAVSKVEIHLNDTGTYIWEDAENFILSQYTGLKDNNGVEIYEGNIIRIKTENTESIHEIIYKDGAPFGRNITVLEHRLLCVTSEYIRCMSEYIEIIGNIYENPELLEV
jgi:hypothetical protein